ncbi:thymidine kinase, putative, partial [Ichthyophthirius multifiliis]
MSTKQQNFGQIQLIYGPMFSGKTSELLRIVKRYSYAKKKCLVVNYIKDNRYTESTSICTHDKITLDNNNSYIQTQKCLKLQEIMEKYEMFDVIAIDEGQFFQDIDEKCDFFANNGKIVLVAALDATFQRKPFNNILNLVCISESVTKLTAVCVSCGGNASFTKRKIKCDQIELIGSSEIYEPVCRTCFYNNEYDGNTQ